MQHITKLKDTIAVASCAAVGGKEERLGPLGDRFDFISEDDRFGQKTWERAEGESCRLAMNFALKKRGLAPEDLALICAGDLQNQCVATSYGLSTFGVPYVGLYGACSTMTEGLMTAAAYLTASEKMRFAAAVTSSHNAAAERQFRSPIEYGGQRTPTAQWTATAAGCVILEKKTPTEKPNGKTADTAVEATAGNSSEYSTETTAEHSAKTTADGEREILLTSFLPGRIRNGESYDASAMGAAMAPAAADTILSYFALSGDDPQSFDRIVTGDLGRIGSDVLRELLDEGYRDAPHLLSDRHRDCGLLLYDREKQDVHAGASGCGCSAAVLALSVLPALKRGEIRKVLFLSTGALMSPSSVQQKIPICSVAPAIVLETAEKGVKCK